MITIDQLLESADLNFEPRFVTKDKIGTVWLWSTKPSRLENLWGNNTDKRHSVGFLILSEFENKPWQECIYEVPQKTTGKIERFTLDDFATVVDVEKCVRSVLDSRVFDKLNTIVDAVNELKGAKNE